MFELKNINPYRSIYPQKMHIIRPCTSTICVETSVKFLKEVDVLQDPCLFGIVNVLQPAFFMNV
jgi:hypothetical protein